MSAHQICRAAVSQPKFIDVPPEAAKTSTGMSDCTNWWSPRSPSTSASGAPARSPRSFTGHLRAAILGPSLWKARSRVHSVELTNTNSVESRNNRLQTSVTRATVEDGMAGLGQTLWDGLWLVGLSFHSVSGMCMNPLVHRLPGGFQALGV